MPDQPDNDGEKPSFLEMMKGLAHAYDTVKLHTDGTDPKTRHVLHNLDRISVEQMLGAASMAIGETGDPQTPHIDTRDEKDCEMVTVDTSGTPVSPSNVDVSVEGSAIGLFDPTTGWESVISLASVDSAGDFDTSVSDSVLTVRVYAEEDNPIINVSDAEDDEEKNEEGDVGDDEADEDDDSGDPDGDEGDGSPEETEAGTTDSGPSDDDATPTLSEFVEDNPWVRSQIPDQMLKMGLTMYGDTPMDELPFDLMGGGGAGLGGDKS